MTSFLLFIVVCLLAFIAQQLGEINRRLATIEERQLRPINRRLDQLGGAKES